jgi:hypothetical protein
MFSRYNIVAEDQKRDALEHTGGYLKDAAKEEAKRQPVRISGAVRKRTIRARLKGSSDNRRPSFIEKLAPQAGLEPTTLRLTGEICAIRRDESKQKTQAIRSSDLVHLGWFCTLFAHRIRTARKRSSANLGYFCLSSGIPVKVNARLVGRKYASNCLSDCKSTGGIANLVGNLDHRSCKALPTCRKQVSGIDRIGTHV